MSAFRDTGLIRPIFGKTHHQNKWIGQQRMDRGRMPFNSLISAINAGSAGLFNRKEGFGLITAYDEFVIKRYRAYGIAH